MSSRPTEQNRPAPTPAATGSAAAPETQNKGLIARVRRGLDAVISEVRKVTWPTRTETRNLTIVVIGISVAVGAILGLVDLLLTAGIRLITTGGF